MRLTPFKCCLVKNINQKKSQKIRLNVNMERVRREMVREWGEIGKRVGRD